MIIWLAGVHRFLEHEYFVYLCLTCVAAIWLAHCMQITSFDLSSRSKVPRWGCILFVQFFFHLFLGVASSQTPLAGFRIWVDFAPSDWKPPEVGYIGWFLLLCLEAICSESKPAYTKFMKYVALSQHIATTFKYFHVRMAWYTTFHTLLFIYKTCYVTNYVSLECQKEQNHTPLRCQMRLTPWTKAMEQSQPQQTEGDDFFDLPFHLQHNLTTSEHPCQESSCTR